MSEKSPFVVIVMTLAALITIVVYLTGKQFFPDLFSSSKSSSTSTAAPTGVTAHPVISPTPIPTIVTSPTSDELQVDIKGEAWSVSITEPSRYNVRPLSDKAVSDFTVWVDLQINDESNEFHGLMLRQQDEGKFYSFRISRDGRYELAIWRAGDGSHESLAGPVESKLIKTGVKQVNRLKVVAEGRQFYLFINETKVASVMDDTISRGKVGFISCTCNGSPSASATFSNAYLQGK